VNADVAHEPIIDPQLPIIDPHHHLWFLPEAALAGMEGSDSLSTRLMAPVLRRRARYLFDEFLTDLTSGHNIRATVFVDAHTMYRSRDPEAMRSLGEVEFVNGVAAMAASGLFGDVAVCAGIVGGVDLTLGERVEEVLEAHLRAGGGRYRGVRSSVVHDDDPNVIRGRVGRPHVLLEETFRAGFSRLARFGLSFEAWVLEPQLPDVVDLARTFPDTLIILNHVGAPLGIGCYDGQRLARFPIWRENIHRLAESPNVAVKLGGLGIPFGGFGSYMADPRYTSGQLAEEWRPYIETCIEAFGVDRCMFESNFPVDSAVGSYAIVWNAFKRLCVQASDDEKAALFAGTAARLYRLEL